MILKLSSSKLACIYISREKMEIIHQQDKIESTKLTVSCLYIHTLFSLSTKSKVIIEMLTQPTLQCFMLKDIIIFPNCMLGERNANHNKNITSQKQSIRILRLQKMHMKNYYLQPQPEDVRQSIHIICQLNKICIQNL